MSDELTTPVVLLGVVLAALVAVALVVGLLALRRQRRTAAALDRAHAEAAALRSEIDAVRRAVTAGTEPDPATGHEEAGAVLPRDAAREARARHAPAPPSYVITRLGGDVPEAVGTHGEGPTAGGPRRTVEVAGRVDGKLFADLLLRETLVRVGAVAHGARRALAPETRHRIRFEMRREVKRSRKERRAEVRQARRELHARQRREAQGVGEGLEKGVA